MSYINGSMLLYEDDKTIVVAPGLNRPSQNEKTGAMTQTFILKKNTPPTYDVKGAGCEDCPAFDGCYVLWHQAPRSVYRAYKSGRYRKYTGSWEDLAMLSRFPMRVGSAGEPTEMASHHWEDMLATIGSWTGYTHKWMVPDNMHYRMYCMASVHSVEDMKQANRNGWRTYRVGGGPITDDEVMCPHYTHDVQCATCGLCKGSSSNGKNIYAPAHGARKSKIK